MLRRPRTLAPSLSLTSTRVRQLQRYDGDSEASDDDGSQGGWGSSSGGGGHGGGDQPGDDEEPEQPGHALSIPLLWQAFIALSAAEVGPFTPCHRLSS